MLYHYCTPCVFLEIISKRVIWLSSMRSSNDSMEGKLIKEICEDIFAMEGVIEEKVKMLKPYVDFYSEGYDGFGFCLSEEGDLLSQWRGYAADGQGLSIGFSSRYLKNLVSDSIQDKTKSYFNLEKVAYDKSEQLEKLELALKHLKSSCNSMDIGAHLKALFTIKNAAFKEEKEWRLISTALSSEIKNIKYRVSHNSIVPYRAYDLVEYQFPEIEEVVIGPKNVTPIHVIEGVLESSGFKSVKVRRSSATYR